MTHLCPNISGLARSLRQPDIPLPPPGSPHHSTSNLCTFPEKEGRPVQFVQLSMPSTAAEKLAQKESIRLIQGTGVTLTLPKKKAGDQHEGLEKYLPRIFFQRLKHQ